MESPDFLPSRDYLLWGENEPVVAGVPQLHGEAGEDMAGAISVAPVGDAGLTQGPVKGSTTRGIQHAGNAPNLICIFVSPFLLLAPLHLNRRSLSA